MHITRIIQFLVYLSRIAFSTLIGISCAHTATITFESSEPNIYFVHDKISAYQPNPYDNPDDGADNLANHTLSEWVAINNGAEPVSNLFWDGGLDGGNNSLTNLLLKDTFNLDHFYITGVYGSQTLTVKGFNDGALLYQQNIFINLTPTLFLANWDSIDQLQFVIGDDLTPHPDHLSAEQLGYWAIDNLTYNTQMGEVPVPAAFWLLASGLFSLTSTGYARRSRQATNH